MFSYDYYDQLALQQKKAWITRDKTKPHLILDANGRPAKYDIVVMTYEQLRRLDQSDPSIYWGILGRITCDEFHNCRRGLTTNQGKILRAFNAPIFHGYSGTLVYNNLADIRGYLDIIAKPSWGSDVDRNSIPVNATDQARASRYARFVAWLAEMRSRSKMRIQMSLNLARMMATRGL